MRLDIFKHLLVASLIMSLYVFTACSVDADLCDSGVHPHECKLKYTFDWGSYADKYTSVDKNGKTVSNLPDSMYVIATRVVNFYKTAMVVGSGVSGKGNSGYFVFNPPKYDPIATSPDADDPSVTPEPTPDPNPEPTPDPNPEEPGNGDENTPNEGGDDDSNTGGNGEEGNTGGNSPLEIPTRADGETTTPDDDYMDAIKRVGPITSEFRLRTGAYKFVTFNMDTASFDYKGVVDYMVDASTDKKMQDIFVEYRPYEKTDDKLGHLLDDWQDYNSYAQYVQPNILPVFLDTIPAGDIATGRHEIKFKPTPVTQNIDIYFTIKKEFPRDSTFAIDSVVCEMAGIPYKINLLNGYLAIEKTRKVMFKTELLKENGEPLGEDDEKNKVVRVHANIDVPSIVENSTSTMTTGPGIMQVMIMAHGTDPGNPDGEPKKKKLQGKINLYNTLKRAKLIKITDDGKYALRNGDSGVLDIVANIVISGGNVIKNNDNNGGLDVWLDYTDHRIIVDI